MARKITNCARSRESMTDAAIGALLGNRADFDAHLRDCAACREEFRVTQTLLMAIDRGLSTSVAAEPSPRLVTNVRQAIAEQVNPEGKWSQRKAWLVAAGACAVLAICFLAVRTSHNTRAIARNPVRSLVSAPPARNHSTMASGPIAPVQLTSSASTFIPAERHASEHAAHRRRGGSEVLVEPGQMQAILRLAAVTRWGRINGTKLVTDEKPERRLEIKPLTIAPLKIAALKDESGLPISEAGQDGTKNFVSDMSK